MLVLASKQNDVKGQCLARWKMNLSLSTPNRYTTWHKANQKTNKQVSQCQPDPASLRSQLAVLPNKQCNGTLIYLSQRCPKEVSVLRLMVDLPLGLSYCNQPKINLSQSLSLQFVCSQGNRWVVKKFSTAIFYGEKTKKTNKKQTKSSVWTF